MKKLIMLLMFFSGVVNAETITLHKFQGTYQVGVTLNKHTMSLGILDTGASEVLIPKPLVKKLIADGTLGDKDLIQPAKVRNADGQHTNKVRVMIRSIKIGNVELFDIPAMVGEDKSELLIGQNVLDRFDTFSVDNKKQELSLMSKNQENVNVPKLIIKLIFTLFIILFMYKTLFFIEGSSK